MKAVTHTCDVRCWLNNSYIAIAIIIARNCAMQHAVSNNLAALKFHNLVTVLCLTAIPVVHLNSPII